MAAGRASTYGKYYTTLEDVANVAGLQLNGAGQPILDPADPTRYFLANSRRRAEGAGRHAG